MILVDPDNLAAHPTRDLAQLAFLIGRGLIDRTDPEIDNRSAHSSTLPVWQRKDAMRRTGNQSIFNTGNWASKMARCLGFSARPFRGVFSYILWLTPRFRCALMSTPATNVKKPTTQPRKVACPCERSCNHCHMGKCHPVARIQRQARAKRPGCGRGGSAGGRGGLG